MQQTRLSLLAQQALASAVHDAAPGVTLYSHLHQRARCSTTAELARLLGCSADSIHRMRADGLPAHKIRARWRYYGPEVAQWLMNQEQQQSRTENQHTDARDSGRRDDRRLATKERR